MKLVVNSLLEYLKDSAKGFGEKLKEKELSDKEQEQVAELIAIGEVYTAFLVSLDEESIENLQQDQLAEISKFCDIINQVEI